MNRQPMTARPCTIVTIALGLMLLVSGCGKPPPPPATPVEGTLYLNGQPLPFAQIDFMPELAHYGAEMNSTAVTDARGRFVMMMANGQTGAAVATHHVVVQEGPPPEGARGMSGESQEKLGQYMRQLANRPIPAEYGNYSKTPLVVEVTGDKREYVLQMNR